MEISLCQIELEIKQVRDVLQKFQDGYTTRDKSKLDEFMQLFAPTDEIELIGVGASERGGERMVQWACRHP